MVSVLENEALVVLAHAANDVACLELLIPLFAKHAEAFSRALFELFLRALQRSKFRGGNKINFC